MAIGLDVGTATLVRATRNKEDKIEYVKEINASIREPIRIQYDEKGWRAFN